MSEIELTLIVPSSDEYINLLNKKFGQHTQPYLVASLKQSYERLLEKNKIKLIQGLRVLSDVEEGEAMIPFGGKSRRKRHKRKTHRNKSKRKR